MTAMPARRTCSFCGNDIEPGTGRMFIRRDGTVYFFCSSKCRRNLLDLGRTPRWTRWTLTYQRAKGKAAEAAPRALPETPAEAGAEGEAAAPSAEEALLTVEAPKGKAIPADVIDLIDHRLGPELPRPEAEHHFARFADSEMLRVQITPWYRKRHPGKHAEKVDPQEYQAFLETPQARKTIKAWLDGESKKLKGRGSAAESEEPKEVEVEAKPKKKAKKGGA